MRRQPSALLARGSAAAVTPDLRVARTKGDVSPSESDDEELMQVTLEAETRSRTATAEEDLTYSESSWLVSSRQPGAGSTPTRCSSPSTLFYSSRTRVEGLEES